MQPFHCMLNISEKKIFEAKETRKRLTSNRALFPNRLNYLREFKIRNRWEIKDTVSGGTMAKGGGHMAKCSQMEGQ